MLDNIWPLIADVGNRAVIQTHLFDNGITASVASIPVYLLSHFGLGNKAIIG